MQAIDKLVYRNITRERMDAIRIQAKAQGLSLDGAKGNSNWDNCGVQYEFDEPQKLLAITASVPFGVTANEIEGAINSIVRKTDPLTAPQDASKAPQNLNPGSVAPIGVKSAA